MTAMRAGLTLDDDAMSNKPDYKKKEPEKVTQDLILVTEDGSSAAA